MPRYPGVLSLLLHLCLVLFGLTPAAFAREAPEGPLVFVQVPLPPAGETPWAASAEGMRRDDICREARLVLLTPEGRVKRLSDGFASACEPEVSFDAQRILFAGKRASADPWNIFELTLQDGSVRQVTHDLGNCRQPAYQSTFYTIVSAEPWYQLTFVSDAAGQLAEYGDRVTTDLYSCRLDGGGVRRLTYNPSGDQDPLVLPDGRVLYVSWQRGLPRLGARGVKQLYSLNSDGTDVALYTQNAAYPIRQMPTVTADGLCVFVESESLPWDGAGVLGSVRLRRPFHSYQALTSPQDGLFAYPAPYAGSRFLASRRPAGGPGSHALVLVDAATRRITPLYDDPAYHDIQARLLAPRPEPDGRSSVVDESDATAQLYALDIGISDQTDWLKALPPLRFRILEGLPAPADGGALLQAAHGEPDAAAPPFAAKRILGEGPVEGDGSFFVTVPANLPLMVQLIDEDGIALRSCNWIWIKNREKRGCIGCHEDPELTPTNEVVDAVKKPAYELTLAPELRRTVSFRPQVAGLIERSCTAASCHDAAARLPLNRREGEAANDPAYARRLYTLLTSRPAEAPADSLRGNYLEPGQARTSPLVWHIVGRKTTQPWDPPSASAIPLLPPDAVSAADRRAVIEWIDLGARWDRGPGNATHSDGGN